MTDRTEISPKNQLSRFIRDNKNHVAPTKGIVKPKAFLPPPDRKLSVCHTQGMMQKIIWQIGDNWLGKIVRYRADLIAESVTRIKLKVILDNNPEYHVNISGWPEDKNTQLSLATELASRSQLKTRDNT